MRASRASRSRARFGVKRALDIVLAAAMLIGTLPLGLGLAAAVRLTQGKPIFFRHERPGLRGKPFELIKFRTMRTARVDEVWYRTDAQRVTRLGRFLRATSLDELPGLLNVLRGEMSIVGPRPLLTEYLDYYSPDQQRRHDMRPGLTGWAAVKGRHALKFDDRIALDVWYVDNWSLRLDFAIIARTALQLLRRDDVAVTQDLAEVGFPLPGVARVPPGEGSVDGTPLENRSSSGDAAEAADRRGGYGATTAGG